MEDTSGCGYWDDCNSWYCLEGFVVRLRGGQAGVDLIPTGVLREGLCTVDVRVFASGCVGEATLPAVLVSDLIALSQNLTAWPLREAGFRFPSASGHEPTVVVEVCRGHGATNWNVRCVLNRDCGPDEDLALNAAIKMEVLFQLDPESIAPARDQLNALLRHLATVEGLEHVAKPAG